MSAPNRNLSLPFPLSSPTLWHTLGQRVRNMTLLWVLLGAAVGGITASHRNVLGVVSGVLAGVILLLPLGAALGLIGARVKLCLIGALGGAVMGAFTGMLASALSVPAVTGVGLLGGGLAGGSSSALLWWGHILCLPRPLGGAHGGRSTR